MKIYKLKALMATDGKSVLRDVYFDVDKITAFYIPEKDAEDEHHDCEFITFMFNGDILTVKQQPHIIDYLNKTFVNNAIVK